MEGKSTHQSAWYATPEFDIYNLMHYLTYQPSFSPNHYYLLLQKSPYHDGETQPNQYRHHHRHYYP